MNLRKPAASGEKHPLAIRAGTRLPAPPASRRQRRVESPDASARWERDPFEGLERRNARAGTWWATGPGASINARRQLHRSDDEGLKIPTYFLRKPAATASAATSIHITLEFAMSARPFVLPVMRTV